jgi:pimeloyl-ACP methyl ester carboxylesterase
MWAEHLPAIAAAAYRAIAVDLPGFGAALPGRELAPWSEVLETMDALGVLRAAIVGSSFGGAVALSVALTAPRASRPSC